MYIRKVSIGKDLEFSLPHLHYSCCELIGKCPPDADIFKNLVPLVMALCWKLVKLLGGRALFEDVCHGDEWLGEKVLSCSLTTLLVLSLSGDRHIVTSCCHATVTRSSLPIHGLYPFKL